MPTRNYIAFDMGAESGRSMLGTLKGRKISIQELNRFPNKMTDIAGRLHWNVLGMFDEMKKGLSLCASAHTKKLDSMAVDTWGVDFGLLGRDGSLVGLPVCYRDARTDGTVEPVFARIPKREVYRITGLQTMKLNTLFQLYSMVRDKSPQLDVATDLLFMPDLFNYFLSGVKRNEFTISTTSQFYSPVTKGWAKGILDKVGIPASILQKIVPPGTVLGGLRAPIRHETGLGDVPVIAGAGHDTAAAVAAVPAEGKDFAYISSGTWCLMGVESDVPIISDTSYEIEVTNEGGVGNTFRVLKNIMGLWLVQRCRASFAKKKEYSYAELTKMAAAAPAFKSLVNPDCADFLNPHDMPAAMAHFCRRTGQPAPKTPAEFVRCAVESIALKYRMTLEGLRRVYAHPINRLHIIGGGSQNVLLNQFAANATGVPVVAGPVEATAIGNIMVQALALGHVRSIAEARDIIKRSFDVKTYSPKDTEGWDAAYERFKSLVG